MNIVVLGMANASSGIGDTPFRDSCVLFFLFSGMVLFSLGIYVLVTRAHASSYPMALTPASGSSHE